MRKLILATASVLALGIGGVAVDHAANAGNIVPNAGWNVPPAPGTSQHLQTAANLSKDDFRQAQLELRNMGTGRLTVWWVRRLSGRSSSSKRTTASTGRQGSMDKPGLRYSATSASARAPVCRPQLIKAPGL